MSRMYRVAAAAACLAAGAWSLLFSLANSEHIGIDLVFVQLPPAPIAVWVLGAFVLGGVGGMLASTVVLWRVRASASMLRRRLVAREREQEQAAGNAERAGA